jgi:hypothetical protein
MGNCLLWADFLKEIKMPKFWAIFSQIRINFDKKMAWATL